MISFKPKTPAQVVKETLEQAMRNLVVAKIAFEQARSEVEANERLIRELRTNAVLNSPETL